MFVLLQNKMQLSYWERNTWFNNIDVVVIGSGIVGLNAALSLKLLDRHLKILVLDRGFLPYGASTRNAGFACFGSLTELIDDKTRMREDEVLKMVMKRWNGLKRLRSILKDPGIGYDGLGGFEVFTDADKVSYDECLSQMEHFNRLLEAETGEKNIYAKADEKIAGFGFHGVQHLIENRFEGQIDTGRMMDVLLKRVRDAGITVLNGIEVNSFREEVDHIYIETDKDFSFKAGKMLVTTNAFARQLLPELEVHPARAQVLVTSPIDNLTVKGTFHYDKGYYYFRNIHNRILLGGGRNLDFEAENTMEFGLTSAIQQRLDELLKTMILPGKNYEIEMRWSGIMGLGTVKSSIIKKVSHKIFCAVRMGGMGIAIGSLVGQDAAELVVISE